MVKYGTYLLEYVVDNKIDKIFVEVKLIMNPDRIILNQNIFYGEVIINGIVKPKLRLFSAVNARFAVEKIGLELKKELLGNDNSIKIINEIIL